MFSIPGTFLKIYWPISMCDFVFFPNVTAENHPPTKRNSIMKLVESKCFPEFWALHWFFNHFDISVMFGILIQVRDRLKMWQFFQTKLVSFGRLGIKFSCTANRKPELCYTPITYSVLKKQYNIQTQKKLKRCSIQFYAVSKCDSFFKRS
jgi:hypothetical protein